jgi:CMP-N,N'-diacetyllegionaminic acid synthase
MRRYLGLIPARGGSKSIPLKNIAPCAGRPLLAWTCEAALRSVRLSRVVLSTDDERIAEVGRACGVEVPFLRPRVLAEDATPSIDVIIHAVEALGAEGDRFDAVVLLQPTSPLRTAAHIDGAIEVFERKEAEIVVSVVEVPHRFHPYSLMAERDGRLESFLDARQTVTRRQELPPLWARNGPAVLVLQSALLGGRDLYAGKTVGYPMSMQDSIDIDSLQDLAEAEAALSSKQSRAVTPQVLR